MMDSGIINSQYSIFNKKQFRIDYWLLVIGYSAHYSIFNRNLFRIDYWLLAIGYSGSSSLQIANCCLLITGYSRDQRERA
jgi:hypothetical protein